MSGMGVLRIEAIGTRKLLRKLDALPAKIRSKIVNKVISKGTTAMKREIVKRVPVGVDKPVDEDGNPRKRLKNSITKRLRIAKGKQAVHGIVGVPPDYPKFVYMLHYGIKAHKVPHPKGYRTPAGRVMVGHPGVRQMDFMRDALTATIPIARGMMATELRTRLASVVR